MQFRWVLLFSPCHGSGGYSPVWHCGSPDSIRIQSMCDLWGTKWHWDKYFGFPCQCYSTNSAYSSSVTCCSYQKDKRTKPWNLLKNSAIPEVREHWTESTFNFFVVFERLIGVLWKEMVSPFAWRAASTGVAGGPAWTWSLPLLSWRIVWLFAECDRIRCRNFHWLSWPWSVTQQCVTT